MVRTPEGVRALAHDARWQAVELLGSLGEATATELAGRVGITPSAMSYHLRALDKAGFVARVPPGEGQDARERRWRLTFDQLELRREDADELDRDALLQFADLLAASFRRRVDAALVDADTAKLVLAQADLALTDDERAAMASELTGVIEKYSELAEARPADAGASVYLVVTPFSSR